jgi:colanic acid biosynthesis glycosyl transferase WcaI
MNLVVICPHFAPDVAPTGEVITRIVDELVARGHRVHVITSLPWYREHQIEPGYEGRLVAHEDTSWGRITRVHPFPTGDKRNMVRRALAYVGFSALTGLVGLRGGRVDAVLAMSPPLTLGVTGWVVAKARRAPFVFNIQDVYPDVAVELGVLGSRRLISVAARLERWCYDGATTTPTPSPSCPTTSVTTSVARRGTPGTSGSSRISSTPTGSDPSRVRMRTARSSGSRGSSW